MFETYRFDRSKVTKVTEGQWSALSQLFKSKWAGMKVTPEEIAGVAHLPRGASLAILSVMDVDGAVDLRLVVYHDCRSRPVVNSKFNQGFPVYPWTCPGCGLVQSGPAHAVVENLRYGIEGKLKRLVNV